MTFQTNVVTDFVKSAQSINFSYAADQYNFSKILVMAARKIMHWTAMLAAAYRTLAECPVYAWFD